MTKDLIIVGAGGHGKEMAWMASSIGEYRVLGFVDENQPACTTVGPHAVLGGYAMIQQYPDAEFIVAIGDLRTRQQVVDRLNCMFNGIRYATLIHPSVVRSDTSVIGEGSVVCAGAYLSVDSRVGSHSIVNVMSIVGHGVVAGDYCTLGPGSKVCGDVVLGDGVEVAAGAIVKQGLRLGSGSMAAMGAVVMKDVPSNAMVLGNPARPLKELRPFPTTGQEYRAK